MKHAFLIIAHHEPEVLTLLLELLDDARNDIYLHIDRRATVLRERFAAWRPQHAGYRLIETPIAVYWADLSQVAAEYLLFETAAKHGPYTYYHLLSGVDLPLKPQEAIHDFFDCHAGCEFVGLWESPDHRRDLERKVKRYYFFTRHLRDKGTLAHALTAPVRNAALAVQKATGLRRPWDYDFRKGYNWASLTHACCEYIIKEKAHVMHRFRHTLAPDEIFLPTLIWNSPFRNCIFDTHDTGLGSQRLVDWERGHPYTWQDKDFDELMRSPLPFARKFSAASPELLRRIHEVLKP